MAVPAGQMNRRVTFRKRALMPASAGTLRDGFEVVAPSWAAVTPGRPTAIVVGSFDFPGAQLVVAVRATSISRGITNAWQVEVGGEVFEVTNVDDRRDGTIRINAQTAPDRRLYAVSMEQRGEAVTLRRYASNGSYTDVPLRARVRGFLPEELVGGISQGERRVLLSAEDVEAAGIAGGVKVNDRIVIRARALNVIVVDDSTHRAAGILNGFELRVAGP